METSINKSNKMLSLDWDKIGKGWAIKEAKNPKNFINCFEVSYIFVSIVSELQHCTMAQL